MGAGVLERVQGIATEALTADSVLAVHKTAMNPQSHPQTEVVAQIEVLVALAALLILCVMDAVNDLVLVADWNAGF